MNGLTMKVSASSIGKRQNDGYLPQREICIVESQNNQKPELRYLTKNDHMICKCLSLSITYAATIGGLITITGTSTNLIFAEQFNSRYPEAQVINFGTWFVFSFPIALIMLFLTWIWLHCLFLGCNFRETCSLSKKRKTKREEMSEKRIQEEYEKLGPVSYPELVTGIFFVLMTLLWFTREPGFVPGWTALFEKKGYRTDATVSLLLAFLLFLIPSKVPRLFQAGKEKAESNAENEKESDALTPMITWKDFQKLMPWEIVILVGGGYALAAGCKSETLQINPLYTLIPATMCVSFGVMLPVGNPPNAIVFSYKHLQISDMVKAGFGVNLIGVVVVMLAIMTWGEPLFQLSEFPDWAMTLNATDSS
ncbi:S13A4 protein, partial [Polypterus senegalus]